jgi:pilus assembly protein CpaE
MAPPSFDSREQGQAAVELVALLPCLVAALGIAWQLVVAGHAVWAATAAARAAARAEAVGAAARVAAAGHLPARLERGLRVRTVPGDGVEVSVRIPSVLGLVDLGRTTATGHFPPQEP